MACFDWLWLRPDPFGLWARQEQLARPRPFTHQNCSSIFFPFLNLIYEILVQNADWKCSDQ